MGWPSTSPRDTASAGSETDKSRAQKPVAEARGETQESRTVTWPTTNEPRSDGLQLAHEREQRRRSETLNPGPARGQDTAESTGVKCKRQTNMRQMAEHLRLKPGSQKTPTVAHDSRHSCTRLRTKDGASATEERSSRSPKPRTKNSTDDSTDRQKLTSTGYQNHGHPRSQSAQSGHQHQLAPTGLRSPGRPKEPGKGLGSVEHRG